MDVKFGEMALNYKEAAFVTLELWYSSKKRKSWSSVGFKGLGIEVDMLEVLRNCCEEQWEAVAAPCFVGTLPAD